MNEEIIWDDGTVEAPKEEIVWDTPKSIKEDGYMTRLTGDINRRVGEASRWENENPNASWIGTQLNRAKVGWGGVGDVIGQGINSVLPNIAKKGLRSVVQAIMTADLTPPEASFEGNNYTPSTLAPLPEMVSKDYSKFERENPELSNVLNATGSAADAAGNLSLITPTAKLVGNLSGKAATKLEEYGIKKTSEDALDMVKRKVSSLTPDEQKKLAQGGKITERGIFNDAEIKTNSFDKEIAKSVEGIVDPKKSWVDNIDRIHTKIGELATKTETLPGMLESATDTNKIREVLDGLKKESSIRFVGDTALESAYNKAIDEFMELLSHKPSTIGNVLEARKEYDILLKKKFPDAFKANADARGSIVKQAGMDVRNAANEFVEGVLPEGNEFKSLLKEQSNLYRATERIAANNLPVLDKNKFQKALELIARHPWLSAEIGGVAVGGAAIGAGGAVASAVTNPLILMALATYGTARVGKTVLTSPMIRDGLIKILTGAERGLLSATDVDGIKKIINSLSEKNYATAPVPSKPPFIDKLAGDTSGSYPTPLALPMPERGFTLQGQPTGEVLHPSKIGSNLYGVKEPSVIEGRMKIDQPLQLEGQGFTTDELWSKVSNTKLQQGSDKGLRNALKRR